jgi:cyclic-di-GMP-binding protein
VSKQQNSFDVVCNIDTQEVSNAVNQAMKEIQTRFDFKGSKSNITFDGKEELVLISDDDKKLRSVIDILKEKLIKRKVPLNGLTYGKMEEAAGNTVRQTAKVQQGIPSEKAKEIVKIIKIQN